MTEAMCGSREIVTRAMWVTYKSLPDAEVVRLAGEGVMEGGGELLKGLNLCRVL